ncbi:MAG: carbohydrate kinase family protein [Lachnospiraceae bacterium]|nr:carbohydrate kinase family protein [Lachnospiraceae bacterium]
MTEPSYDIICMGMALIDSILKGYDPRPVSATGYRAGSCTLNIGGEAVNAAMAASKLGMRTAICCALGADPAGDMIVRALEQTGVDCSRVLRPGEHSTPVTTMFVNEDGSRRSITTQAHRYNFHPEENERLFTDAGALLLGSLFRAPFDDPESLYQVLQAAKDAGQMVFADTKLPNFRVLKLEDLRESLPLMDYITPNEDEARYYTGKETPEDMAEVFLDLGVKNVLIKLGAKGCYFRNREKTIKLPACNIRAVDATGAGDNLLAGFASELLRGASIEDALEFANACGGICTTAVGAGTALINREQVLAFLGRSIH